ncbi:MAG: hypothetical protein RBR74_02630, partial [Ignavibacteriaceae bacterium]|nr:hypothetical protein [Ignavibacteriaceae bacterium]
MKTMFFYILSLFNCVMFAQTPDPYKFFPSAVGNVWEYNHTIGVYQREIIRDSVLENGSRLIYFNTLIDPAFRIDSAYKCYYDPLFLNWFYYKLDSDSGEVWIVDSLDSGAGMTYKLALCKNQYNGQIFGM